ncbi:hypothetical protein D3C71_2090770 [compost metagenome]
MKNLHNAMDVVAANLQSRKTGDTLLLSPKFPRIAWKIAGTMGWNAMAKQNGIMKKEIRRRLP